MTILHLFLALSTLAGASGRTSMPILQLIQEGQVDAAAIHDDAVDTGAIRTDAVTTPKIINSAVNTSKLAPDAVTTAKIITAAVETAKLASDSVTSAKLLSSEASCTKVSGGDITCSGGAVTIPVSVSGVAASGGLGIGSTLNVIASSTTLDNATNATDALTVKVNSNDKGIIFKNSATDSMLWWLRRNGSADNAYMKFGNGGAESMVFNGAAQSISGAAASGGLGVSGAATVVKSSFSITGDNSALVVLGAADTTKFIVQPGGSVGIGTASPGQKLEVAGNALIATGALDTNKIVMNVPAVLGSADSAKIGIGLVNPVGHLHVMSGSADTAKVSIGDATHGGCIMMGTTSGCFECGISGITFTCAADADCVCDGTF